MSPTLSFICTLAVATVGGLLARKLKLPAGAILGSMVAVIIFNLTTGYGVVPTEFRPVLQTLSGALVGYRITKSDVIGMKTLLLPALILVAGMIVLNVMIGIIVHYIGGIDFATALFASCPGGVTDIALIADELGADTAKVGFMQAVRLLSLLAVYPVLFSIIGKKGLNLPYHQLKAKKVGKVVQQTTGEVQEAHEAFKEDEPATPTPEESIKTRYVGYILTFSIAIIGALLGLWSGISAGALIGAMFATAAFNTFTGRLRFPNPARVIVQICAGAFVGARMGPDMVASLGQILLPTLVMVVGMILCSLAVGLIMYRFCGMNFISSIMSCAPGGLTEMIVFAEDLECDLPRVAMLHTIRVVMVFTLMPTLLGSLAAMLT